MTVTETLTATVTATPAAVTQQVKVVETVTAEAATQTITADAVTETVTAMATVTETVQAQVQGFANLPAERASPTPAAPAPPAAPAAQPGPVPPPNGWKNCTQAWDAGAAPVHRDDPGYHSRLDRDGDGIGCERRP